MLNSKNNNELMKEFPLQPFNGLPGTQQVKKWTDFSKTIKTNKKDKLSTMSGFVSLDMAVKADADKKRVLEQMEKQDLDWLPVVKQENGVSHFQGIVERSRLTASLILDVTNQLENKKKEQTN